MAKIKGNNDDDDLFGKSSNDQILGYGGDDFIFGAAGNDTIAGGGGDDQIVGGKGNDNLTGGAGADYIIGGAGNDILKGALDNDVLIGGAGKDIIIGGAGRDIMTGGEGDDIFRFVPGIQSPSGLSNPDVINDFQQIAGTGGDKLEIPAGTTIVYNGVVDFQGFGMAWYIEYSGGGNSGFTIMPGLLTAPDYEFV